MNLKTGAWITAGLIAAFIIVFDVAFAPDTFTVNSKQWKCVGTRPTGIGAECTVLERKDIGGLK